MSDTFRFQLKDADGKLHAYVVVFHDVESGERILWRLAELFAEPMAGLLSSHKGDLGAVLAGDRDAASSLDLTAAAAACRRALAGANMPALTRELLANAVRDGRPLDQPAAFNDAYRRNYGEMLQAAWEVVKANRFFPQFGTFAAENGSPPQG